MNRSDILTSAAVLLDEELKYNGREIRQEGATTAVLLFGRPCIEIDRRAGTVTVHGDTPVTKKSCRVINSVLCRVTGCRVRGREGTWYLKVPGERLMREFAGEDISIPLGDSGLLPYPREGVLCKSNGGLSSDGRGAAWPSDAGRGK